MSGVIYYDTFNTRYFVLVAVGDITCCTEALLLELFIIMVVEVLYMP